MMNRHVFSANLDCIKKHSPSIIHCIKCGWSFEKGNHFEVIDITPYWANLLPVIMEALKAKIDSKEQEGLYLELQRMAEAADKWNEYIKTKT